MAQAMSEKARTEPTQMQRHFALFRGPHGIRDHNMAKHVVDRLFFAAELGEADGVLDQ